MAWQEELPQFLDFKLIGPIYSQWCNEKLSHRQIKIQITKSEMFTCTFVRQSWKRLRMVYDILWDILGSLDLVEKQQNHEW